MPIEATSLPPSVPCNFPSSYYTSDLEMKLICKAFVNTKTYVYYTQNLRRFILEFALKCLKKIKCSIYIYTYIRYDACYLTYDAVVHLQGSHYGTLVGKVTFGEFFSKFFVIYTYLSFHQCSVLKFHSFAMDTIWGTSRQLC